MSATRMQGRTGPWLKCDVCPEPEDRFGTDPYPTTFRHWGADTIPDIRRLAKLSGWRREANRDVCPKHPKLKGVR